MRGESIAGVCVCVCVLGEGVFRTRPGYRALGTLHSSCGWWSCTCEPPASHSPPCAQAGLAAPLSPMVPAHLLQGDLQPTPTPSPIPSKGWLWLFLIFLSTARWRVALTSPPEGSPSES